MTRQAAVYTPAIRNQHRLSAEYCSTARHTASKTAAGPVLNFNQHKLIAHICGTHRAGHRQWKKVSNSWPFDNKQSAVKKRHPTTANNNCIQPIMKSNTRRQWFYHLDEIHHQKIQNKLLRPDLKKKFIFILHHFLRICIHSKFQKAVLFSRFQIKSPKRNIRQYNLKYICTVYATVEIKHVVIVLCMTLSIAFWKLIWKHLKRQWFLMPLCSFCDKNLRPILQETSQNFEKCLFLKCVFVIFPATV